MTKACAKFFEDTGALWNYFELTGCRVKATGEGNDNIFPQKFKETGGYIFNESHGYFGQIDHENSNTEQGEQRVEDNVPTNKEGLAEELIECRSDAIGVACDLDEDASGAMKNDGLLLSDAIEGGRFFYVPHPEDLKNGLAPGSFSFVMFTTGWDRGMFQASKRMP